VLRKAVGQWTFNLVVLAVVGGTLAGIIWLFALAIREGSTIVAATLASLATVSAALIVRYFERRKELESTRRQHLGPLYEHLGSVLAGQDMAQRKREKVIFEFMRKSLIYASPGVLKAFREWREQLPDGDGADDVTREDMLRYESFVKAMRKDLGVSNFTLQDGDLCRAVLTDFDQLYGQADVDALVPPESLGHAPRVTTGTKS
jgi:hypothetical protein